jgi:hypothetical protein
MTLCVGGSAGAPVDCAAAPTVACLSAEIFSLGKALPADSYLRPRLTFAEQELAPGDIKTALAYVVDDNPDPSPWEDIAWIAQAGRFDRAIEKAEHRSAPVERLGGLLAVAARMLDKNDRVQATRLLDEVERELPSATLDDEYAVVLPDFAARIRGRLGQTERAARLLAKSGPGSVATLLAIANKYPAAASLREQAWREAERVDQILVWQLLFDDAKSRADKADISRVAQGTSRSIDAGIGDDHVYVALSLARKLLEAGFPEPAAKLVKQWRRWVQGKPATSQLILLNNAMPLLVGLGLDEEVQAAASSVSNDAYRSQCLSTAAEEYFRVGRDDIARQFDALALRVAISSPTGEPKLQRDHDWALRTLALARADRGDVPGAFDATARLRDQKRAREVTPHIVSRAIDNGHGPIAEPAIRAMEQQASAAQDARVLLQAADDWRKVGDKEDARRVLSQTLQMLDGQPSTSTRIVGDAAELMWRLDGNEEPRALLGIVDKLQVNEQNAIDRLVEIVRPRSPAVAVQLASRQVSVEARIRELATIAIGIADGKN